MTTPRFFTDPKSGASYDFGDKLPHSDVNALLAGLRRLDYAIERNQATEVAGENTLSGVLHSAIALDRKHGQFVSVRALTGSSSITCSPFDPNGHPQGTRAVNGEPAGGWTTTTSAIASDGEGTVVVGAETPAASADKVAVSTDGEDFTVQSINNAGAGVGVRAMIWCPFYEKFILALDTGAGANIEDSPDGVTWTSRTTPAADLHALATNELGTVVALYDSSSALAIRSTNGSTWSTVALPAAAVWKAVTYSKGLGKWFASDGGANWATSTDGSTWAAGTFTDAVGTGSTPYRLGCLGNIIVAQDGAADIWVSDDGETFVRVADGGVGSASLRYLSVTSAGWVSLAHDGTDTHVRIGSLYHV